MASPISANRAELLGIEGETVRIEDRKAGHIEVALANIHSAKLVLTDRLLAAAKPLDTAGADEFDDEDANEEAAALQEQED